MCLPNFIEFRQIEESSPIIGYRNWKVDIKTNKLELLSEFQNYIYRSPVDGPHEVKDRDSGIYSYCNYNYNNYYNYYDDYNYCNKYLNHNHNYYNYKHNKNHNYSHNYYYHINGIIEQFGKVAIHQVGYRSEYAKIKTLFTIRESDATGLDKFLNWIKKFNSLVSKIAIKYNANVISWQDHIELLKK